MKKNRNLLATYMANKEKQNKLRETSVRWKFCNTFESSFTKSQFNTVEYQVSNLNEKENRDL